ncbi:DUF1569 domain-containing protein [Mucilaginibacter ginsenosidivorans]|uniref:DUF1569 domain-containing protein n=1 Tax=Mucilaginibacter ginsenosidivorans TaxID=398053 RepID=A0A5B8UTY2_9SPHI|nr:DUF1569 domain-containing protein [Mucilaginibacter ginsenosidivorans]QEC61841.1 DUF1569 domain-containing protein [Mucilaginibacter ginsenosidivorans]
MKTVFEKTTRNELIRRINRLNENSARQWGKMNLYQMMKHCTLWDEMIFGEKQYKQMFLGRLFGKMALKNMLKDDKPVRRNSPTVPGFVVSGNGDYRSEKAKWINLLSAYENFSNDAFVHPFFGKMTKEQVGQLAYKHIDHHLRQFNT